MPYSRKQNKLFWAAAKSPEVAKKVGIPQETAFKMAHEGVKKPAAGNPVKRTPDGRMERVARKRMKTMRKKDILSQV